jgi:hypothetical protein
MNGSGHIESLVRKGQKGKTSRQWTGTELAILKDIKKSGNTLKESMDRLPGRTYLAAKTQQSRLPGGKKKRGRASWVWATMQRVLKETPGLTNRQLAEVVGCTRNGIQSVLDVEHGKRVYVSDWCRSGTLWVAQYSLGSLPDVEKPLRRTKEETQAAQNASRRIRKASSNPFSSLILQLGAAA